MSKYGRRAPSSRMTRSRSSGLLKSQELPSGPGRPSNAPAGKTPSPGQRAATAVARGGENASPPPWPAPRLELLQPQKSALA
eukprot:3598215-Alexandrium_andersonii.AAC.1